MRDQASQGHAVAGGNRTAAAPSPVPGTAIARAGGTRRIPSAERSTVSERVFDQGERQ